MSLYYLHDFWEEYGDPRMSKFPLIYGGPWKVIAISLCYLYAVKSLIPTLMKGREPFDLRRLMLLHNSFLIGVNGCGFFVGLWVTNMMVDTWACNRPDPSPTDLKPTLMLYLGYIYFLTKMVDFMDTIFFVLRKRYHQATFLHLFHHSVMPVVAYVGMKFAPTGYSGFLPVINIMVHAIMYSYYALACSGAEMKKHLWWKKHITQVQMVQFFAVMIHSGRALIIPNCWPWYMAIMEFFHGAAFFWMFSSFYRRAYMSPKNTATPNSNKNGIEFNNNINNNKVKNS